MREKLATLMQIQEKKATKRALRNKLEGSKIFRTKEQIDFVKTTLKDFA